MTIVLDKPLEWHAARKLGIGGSDVSKIMSGQWRDLWLDKTGRQEPEDLSGNLAVQMGTFTEPFNLHWFTKQTGLAVRTDLEVCIHPVHRFMRANLDGLCESGLVEAKHVSAFAKDEEIVSRYYGQCQHNMACAGKNMAYLTVFFGNSKWAYFEVARDETYIEDLTERETDFWRFVEADEMPPDNEGVAAIAISFDSMREISMTGNNAWASFAADWIAHKENARKFEDASNGIKELVEADVKLCFGHGIKCARSKAGSLTIRLEK